MSVYLHHTQCTRDSEQSLQRCGGECMRCVSHEHVRGEDRDVDDGEVGEVVGGGAYRRGDDREAGVLLKDLEEAEEDEHLRERGRGREEARCERCGRGGEEWARRTRVGGGSAKKTAMLHSVASMELAASA